MQLIRPFQPVQPMQLVRKMQQVQLVQPAQPHVDFGKFGARQNLQVGGGGGGMNMHHGWLGQAWPASKTWEIPQIYAQ